MFPNKSQSWIINDVLITRTSSKLKPSSLLKAPLTNEKASHSWEKMFVIHISDEGMIAII